MLFKIEENLDLTEIKYKKWYTYKSSSNKKTKTAQIIKTFIFSKLKILFS